MQTMIFLILYAEIPLISFSSLVAMPSTCKIMLNKNGSSGHPSLVFGIIYDVHLYFLIFKKIF